VTPTYRHAAPADFDQIIFLDGAAFSIDYTPQDVDDVRSLLDLDRFLLAEDDGEVVGVAGDYRFEMTVPGAPTPIPVPGVTWVSVRATHRRQGILSTLMHRQLAALATALRPGSAPSPSMRGRRGLPTRRGHRASGWSPPTSLAPAFRPSTIVGGRLFPVRSAEARRGGTFCFSTASRSGTR
jgi:GNAT superfamily N-acetyltransferase